MLNLNGIGPKGDVYHFGIGPKADHRTSVNLFFAMHFQPERTTLPLGGAFNEQYNAINILSKSIPPDWVIAN